MKQQMRWIKWTVVGLAGVLIAACSGVNTLFNPASAEATPLPVVTNGASIQAEARVMPSRYVYLAFNSAGRIAELSAVDGASVEKDAILAGLDDSGHATAALRSAQSEQEAARQVLDTINKDADYTVSQAALAAAKAKSALMEAQKAFDDTQTVDFRNRLDDKETIVQDRQTTLDDRKTDLDKYTNLDVNNFTRSSAQNSYDAALEDYNQAVYDRDLLANQSRVARMALDEADQLVKKTQRDVDKLSGGADPDLLAQAQKRLDAADAQVASAQKSLDDLKLTAPFAGLIAEVKPLEIGGMVSAGQPVVSLADTSAWYVETTDLTELDVVQVQVGDEVTIKVDALPDADVRGEVVSVAQNYTEKSGDVLYKVRIRCNNPPQGLRWGMTANVSFGSR